MDARSQSLIWLIPLTPIFTLAARCDNSLDVMQQAQSQSKAGVQVVVAQSPTPAFQGVAGGELALFKHQENNLKASVLAHPVPEVWLVFAPPAESEKPQSIGNAGVATVKVELPQEAEQTIQSQWELVLARQYEREVVGVRDAKSGISNDVAVMNSFLNTGRELQKLLINAPDGKRNISQDEAYSIASFINASAADIIKQAKKYKE